MMAEHSRSVLDDDVEQELRRRLERLTHGHPAEAAHRLDELDLLDDPAIDVLAIAVEELAAGLTAPDFIGAACAARALWRLGAELPAPRPDAAQWPSVLTAAVGTSPSRATVTMAETPSGVELQLVPSVTWIRTGFDLDPGRYPGRVSEPRPHGRVVWVLDSRSARLARSDWLVLLAADSLGTARAALASAVRHASGREAFGRPIGAFQAVRHRCAEMFVDVEASRAVVHGAAAALHAGSPDGADLALVAACTAVPAAVRTAEAAAVTFGAMGFTAECDAHRLVRRAYANESLCASVDTLRSELALSTHLR